MPIAVTAMAANANEHAPSVKTPLCPKVGSTTPKRPHTIGLMFLPGRSTTGSL